MANKQICGVVVLGLMSVLSFGLGCGGEEEIAEADAASLSSTGEGGFGGDDGHGHVGGDDGEDTTAPTILSIVPPDGATGVPDDASIIITFSEPMNKASAQAAYQSADIIAADAMIMWNSDGTELTIDPNSYLEYASGSDPATVTPKSYRFLVSTVAEDLAGNALAEQVDVTFYTLRLIEDQPLFASDHPLTGHWRSDNTAGTCNSAVYCVGDSGSAANAHYYLGLTFDLSPVLPQAFLGFAELSATQAMIYGNPYADLGALNLEHVTYSTLDSVSPGSLFLVSPQPTGDPVGAFSTTADLEDKVVDVLSQVEVDLSPGAGNGLSQFRLRWTATSDFDNQGDGPGFDKNSVALFLTYLAP